MSEMKHHIGRAKEIFPEGETYKEKINWLKNKGHEFEYEDEDDTHSDTVKVLFGNRFFEVDDKSLDHFHSEASKNKDDSYNYNLSFYNGGTYFEEALEEAIKSEENNLTKEK